MDGLIAYALAKKAADAYTDSKFDGVASGVTFKGSVASITDLPTTAAKGDEYVINNEGLYIYDGVNWISASKGGSGGSSLITVARDIDLIYDDTPEQEKDRYFYAIISGDLFPSDFTTPGKYNLIVVITGESEGSAFGYTANHFCYLSADGLYLSRCIDNYENEGIFHFTAMDATENGYDVYYQCFLEDTKVLSEEGSKVSIYLQ